MKRIVLLIGLLTTMLVASAQTTTEENKNAPYLKVPHIPPFAILQTDSVWFYKKDLPKNTPIVIIYFSPDCSHCQWEVKEIIDSMQYFQKAFFVLGAYKNMGEIKEFNEKYKVSTMPNMRIGRDTSYFLPQFYKVKFTPFIAVYDEDGNFMKAFPQGAQIAELKALLYNVKRKRKKKH